MKEIENLKPFLKFCCSIGYIPTSYKAGMTYEEQLFWLCDFLKNEVIPTVNQNGQAVEELQNLYIELKSYVDNYFDNLDIQEEVNKKLNEMAESGELAELISQYLESQAVIGFNTTSALSQATNLANGSITRTLGRNQYNDGYGAFYKIRIRTNADIPDGYNIIVLTNTENLVAEKIPDSNINSILESIDYLNKKTTEINNKTDYYNIELQPHFFYDLEEAKNVDGGFIYNDLIYVYGFTETSYPYGDLYVFNPNGTFVSKISNLKLYHGNDFTVIGSNCYCAACTGDTGNEPSRKIVVINLLNMTTSEIEPFVSLTNKTLFGIAKLNNEKLICALITSDTQYETNIDYYIYDINTSTYEILTKYDNINVQINTTFGVTQGIEFYNNRLYLSTASGSNTLVEYLIDEANKTITINKLYNMPYNCSYGQNVGEIESIIKISGNNNSFYIVANTFAGGSTATTSCISLFICNFTTNLPIVASSIFWNNNIGGLGHTNITVNSEYSGLYEDGSDMYPFKDLFRAIAFAKNSKVVNVLNIDIKGGTSYNLNAMTNVHNINIRNKSNNPITLYNVSFYKCYINFEGDFSTNSEFTIAGNCSLDNSNTKLKDCIINSSNRFKINYQSKLILDNCEIKQGIDFLNMSVLHTDAIKAYNNNLSPVIYGEGYAILYLPYTNSLPDNKVNYTASCTVFRPGYYH